MHTIEPSLLAHLEATYGRPRVLHLEWEITDAEMLFVRASRRGWRSHDVTLLIFGPDGRMALIQKPKYPPGVWRNPGGGVNPGEDFAAGARREGLEETGLHVALERYLLRVHVVFTSPEGPEPWITHVFTARTADTECAPRDAGEIAAAAWFTLDDYTGPIRAAILQSGRRLMGYRAWLHDQAAGALRDGPR